MANQKIFKTMKLIVTEEDQAVLEELQEYIRKQMPGVLIKPTDAYRFAIRSALKTFQEKNKIGV